MGGGTGFVTRNTSFIIRDTEIDAAVRSVSLNREWHLTLGEDMGPAWRIGRQYVPKQATKAWE